MKKVACEAFAEIHRCRQNAALVRVLLLAHASRHGHCCFGMEYACILSCEWQSPDWSEQSVFWFWLPYAEIIALRGIKVDFKNKKVIVLGESDGIPSGAIAPCVQAAGGEVVFQTTQFFV